MKEIGCPSCIGTTSIPFPESSHSTIKVFLKSGVAEIGDLHTDSLSCWKDWFASKVQENVSFFSDDVRGDIILP